MKYKIVSDCRENVENEVNQLLSSGWELRGDITTISCKDFSSKCYTQVMILKEEPKKQLLTEGYQPKGSSEIPKEVPELKSAIQVPPVIVKVLKGETD